MEDDVVTCITVIDEKCEVIIEETITQKCTSVENTVYEEECSTTEEETCDSYQEYVCDEVAPQAAPAVPPSSSYGVPAAPVLSETLPAYGSNSLPVLTTPKYGEKVKKGRVGN